MALNTKQAVQRDFYVDRYSTPSWDFYVSVDRENLDLNLYDALMQARFSPDAALILDMTDFVTADLGNRILKISFPYSYTSNPPYNIVEYDLWLIDKNNGIPTKILYGKIIINDVISIPGAPA